MSEAWNQGVASVYNIMYTSYNFMLEQVPAAATRILNIPRGLFGIFFGRRKMRLALTVDYDREVKKAFWTNVMERYYSESHEWGSVLWNYIFVHFEARLHEPIL